MSVDAVNRGDVPPSMRRKWRNFEARIQRLKRECNTGVRNDQLFKPVLEMYMSFVALHVHCIVFVLRCCNLLYGCYFANKVTIQVGNLRVC
jgi:hypothetical protein